MDAPVALESPDCLLCGGSDFTVAQRFLVDQVWRKPGTFQVSRCSACGFLMSRPRPVPGEALGFYYDEAYSGEGGDTLGLKGFYESDLGKLLNKVRVWIIMKVTTVDASDRLLEVGCSYGGFLREARTLTDCAAHGLDFDEGSIEGAVDPEEIEYRTGTLSEADYADGQFTLVCMYHLLEHVPDPLTTLRAAHRVLAPGGHVSIEVPNARGVWRYVFGRFWLPWFMPQHISHFTPATLSRALELAGFEVVRQQSMFFPIEFAASFSLCAYRVLGLPRPTDPPSWRRWPAKIVDGLAFLGWFLVDIPSQLLFRYLGGSGTQVAIGRKTLKD